jgi:N-acetylglucosaminyldiphosphoundecaprenol N-acetyl-beta-D-mannosaminyltransferase
VTASVEILGVRVTAQSYAEAIEWLLVTAKARRSARVHFVNVHNLIEAQRDDRLRTVFAGAEMLCTDGMPLAWLARRRGVRDAQRVSGPDVMLSLCDLGRAAGLRHYFLGGRPGVAEALVAALSARFPGLSVAGTHEPPFRPAGALEDQALIDVINASQPDVVWVGLGSPKQEYWAADHQPRLHTGLIIPVGAAFDFNSGRVRRAPRWMRHTGLEWLFRLAMDPRRLVRRYLGTNSRFIYLLAVEQVRARLRRSRGRLARPSLDRLVRQSWLGRRIGWLRHASPATYTALRILYRRVTTLGRPSPLDAYQRRAADSFLRETPRGLLDAGVLEVGSDISGDVLRYLVDHGVNNVVGINPAWSPSDIELLRQKLPDGARVMTTDLLSSGLPSASVGAVFSVAVFEHLLAFDACLEELHRVLVPGGRVYASFGPIWSSSLGHHVFVDRGDIQLRHWDPRRNPIHDHEHLLLTADEMRSVVAERRSRAAADLAVEWIYAGDQINRLFFEDFVSAFERSAFHVVRLETDEERVPPARLAALRARYPSRTVFDVRNATVVLEKAPEPK